MNWIRKRRLKKQCARLAKFIIIDEKIKQDREILLNDFIFYLQEIKSMNDNDLYIEIPNDGFVFTGKVPNKM